MDERALPCYSMTRIKPRPNVILSMTYFFFKDWAFFLGARFIKICPSTVEYLPLTTPSPIADKNEPRHDKTNKMSVRPAKTQISLGIRPVWSESLLSAWRNLGSLATHWAHSEDSDQTGRMPRLIWVFAGCTLILLVLSCCGSNDSTAVITQVIFFFLSLMYTNYNMLHYLFLKSLPPSLRLKHPSLVKIKKINSQKKKNYYNYSKI